MRAFPHHYHVAATAEETGVIDHNSEGLPALLTDAPAEFDGPGDRWSPETLLVATVADCLILSFRAIARLNQFPWLSLACEAEGTLDRVDRVTQFTEFRMRATLRIPPEADEDKARRLLERAEGICLVTNSLKAPVHLQAAIEVAVTA